jgi:hypothetical protein
VFKNYFYNIMLTKVLFSVLCCLAVASAFEDDHYDMLDDLLSTEETFDAVYISDVESQVSLNVESQAQVENEKCTGRDGTHAKSGINNCHFWGMIVSMLYSWIRSLITKLGPVAQLVALVLPCVVDLGVNICLTYFKAAPPGQNVTLLNAPVKLLACALCALCKAFLPDFFCNYLGDAILEVVNGSNGSSSSGPRPSARRKRCRGTAARCRGSSLESEAQGWPSVSDAWECFTRDLNNAAGDCAMIGNLVMGLFTSTPDTGGGSGGGSGSDPDEDPSSCAAIDNATGIVGAIIRLLTDVGRCAQCLNNAVGGGSGGGSSIFGDGVGQMINGLVSFMNDMISAFCCLGECNCLYQGTVCKSEDIPKKTSRRRGGRAAGRDGAALEMSEIFSKRESLNEPAFDFFTD